MTMAQNLITITPEALHLQLPSISFGTLKRMYEQLYQHMRNYGSVLTDSEHLSIQRKITKIQGELKRRTKLGKDFNAWEQKLMRKLSRG